MFTTDQVYMRIGVIEGKIDTLARSLLATANSTKTIEKEVVETADTTRLLAQIVPRIETAATDGLQESRGLTTHLADLWNLDYATGQEVAAIRTDVAAIRADVDALHADLEKYMKAILTKP
jgi:hypothetical protein